MEDVNQRAKDLQKKLVDAFSAIDIDGLEKKMLELQEESQDSEFWSDSSNAQGIMKNISSLQNRLRPWRELETGLKDVQELAQSNDDSLQKEVEEHLTKLESKFAKLEKELQFSGKYDDNDAILSVYAGAGGTDAQDWAEMLLRMYTRYGEKEGFNMSIVDQSSGEEAGIKSATIELDGNFAYGKLKAEHGVHRLVRLSPFNSDNLRQTSFAKIEVMPKIESPTEVELSDDELKIDVYRAGGHGGQSVNTTDSAVRVTHIPTGITVSIQNERSQIQNKETALTILRSKLTSLRLEQHKEKVSDLKGPNQSAEWGNQIRSYVLHPYKQVKDLRTGYESGSPDKVLDGDLEGFIEAYLNKNLGNES
ncbi:MAG: peptide chain release factor 2 [bacterium]|nr:peptide chain release factor 2 [bacterium]